MKNERDPWIRVKDESELREGMAVQLRTCAWCGRRAETFWLGRELPVGQVASNPDGSIGCPSGKRRFSVKGRTCGAYRHVACYFGGSIRDGRLYRLADDQLADDAEPATVVRGREMERAR